MVMVKRRYDQAHRDRPLVMFPNNRPVWEDDPILDVRMPERIRGFVALVLIALVTTGVVLLLSLPGN
jgi:hypothetical protein